MTSSRYNIVLAGVGGQGLMLLNQVLGNACARTGTRVITAEQHGLAQRSGSISVHLRLGEGVKGPLIPYGSADLVISLEPLEVLRVAEFLRPDGVVVTSTTVQHPVGETLERVKKRKENLPPFTWEKVAERLGRLGPDVLGIEAADLAVAAGSGRAENVVLLGAVSAVEGFPLQDTVLRETVAEIVPPKTVELNLRAFDAGRDRVLSPPG